MNYRWYTRARYYRAHADQLYFLNSLTTLKINSRTNRGTSKGFETPADEYLMRQIQICFDFFVGTLFPLKRSKIDFTKIVKVDLDSLCQELSNGGLGMS